MASFSGPQGTFTILHFNDVYNLESGKAEPVGGAAKMSSVITLERERCEAAGLPPPLITFGGDALNPSMCSTFFKGRQMIPILNHIGVSVACVGNHDLDFGIENMEFVMGECKFPWLLANIIDKSTSKPLAHAEPTVKLDHHGIKVGFVGLAEEDWIATLGTINADSVEYEDFVACGIRHAKELRADGCDAVFAISHMREPNDVKLAEGAGAYFDAILGGHDHHYVQKTVGVGESACPVLKAGTEWRWMSKATFTLGASGGAVGGRNTDCVYEKIEVTSSIADDAAITAIAKTFNDKLGSSMDVVIGETAVDLEGRFLWVRTRETNLGNIVCDLLRTASNADICILNGGTLRSDTVHKAGSVTYRDLVSISPLLDEMCVLEMTGAAVKEALENACCKYPKLEGRFAQVSGVHYTFDAALEPGSRVVDVQSPPGTPLDMEKMYSVSTKEYLSNGKDGYTCFLGKKMLASGEESPMLPTTLRNHFTTLDVLNRLDGDGSSVSAAEAAAIKMLKMSRSHTERVLEEQRAVGKSTHLAARHPATHKWCLAPSIEGRITTLNPADETCMTK